MVAVSADGIRLPIARARVTKAARAVLKAERVRGAILSVTFVTNSRIRAMNRRHLRRDRVTDVIAFHFRRTAKRAPVVGDVYIAPDVARKSAAEAGIRVREELIRLVVHGTLHVLGHDHPEGPARTKSAMWRKQERLVRRIAAS